jgi:hypothetical protein
MSRVNRFERLDASLKPPKRMDNGFLRVEGRIARVGVQEYQRADGSVHRELRLPEEVFDGESLESFQCLPVTNRHPPGMLTARNAKQFQVGSVGESVRQDGDYVAASMMITDEAAIAAAEAGRSQLSNGYSCELDTTQDPALIERWGKYDSIQRKIRGNHVALVDVARAGPGASLRLDAMDAMTVNYQSMANEEQKMHRFLMDGLTIEVADANAQAIIEKAISAQKDRADIAEGALVEARKGHDAEVKALKAELAAKVEQASKLDSLVAERVKSLGALGAELSALGVDTAKLDASEEAYLKAGIAKRNPKLVTDGDDLAALKIMWRTLKGTPEPSAVDKARAGIGVETQDAVDGSADAARRRYNERLFSVGK